MEAVTSSEFQHWLAWYRLFPFDEGYAELAAMLGNIYRDQKRHAEPFTRADFLPGLNSPDENVDVGELLFNRLRPMADKNG